MNPSDRTGSEPAQPTSTGVDVGNLSYSDPASLENPGGQLLPNYDLPEHKQKFSLLHYNRAAAVATGLAVLIILGVGIGALVLGGLHKSDQSATEKTSEKYKAQNLSVSNLSDDEVKEIGQADKLSVNGQLQVQSTLVISPTNAPSAPTVGQIYLDKASGTLRYYNGTGFVSLGQQQTVTTLGGISGDVTLSGDFLLSGNRLSLANSAQQQPATVGVTSFQGQNGAVTLSAGAGVSISGTTIGNSGVLSIAGGNGLQVSGPSGAITIALPQAIGTASSPTFAGLQLSSALGVTSGGTGLNTITSNEILIGGAGNTVSQLTNGAAGLCLVTNAPGTAPSFQACSGAGGVSSVNGQNGAITIANASGAAGTVTIDNAAADGSTKGIATFSSANFAAATGVISIKTGGVTTTEIADGTITATDIANTTITGGKIAGATVANGNLVNSALTVTAGTGLGGGGSISLGGSASLSVNYGSATGTAVQGNVTLTCPSGTGNLTGGGDVITLGVGGSCSGIDITSSPIFAGTLTVQGSGGVTIGKNSVAGVIKLSDGAATSNTATISVAGALGSNQSYALPTTGGTICVLEAGNCTGANGGGITSSGTPTQNYLTKFTNAGGSTIGNSAIYNDATGVSIGGASPTALFNVGTTNQFQVNSSGTVTAVGVSAGAGLLQGTGGLTIGGTTTFSSLTSGGGQCLTTNGTGVLSLVNCLSGSGGGGGGVIGLNGLSGTLAIANATGSGSTVTIDDAKADDTTKGIAAFNSINFTDAAGVINTIQDIDSSATPTFGGLTLSTALTVGNGGTGATSAANARTNLGAAASGANGDITSLTGLTTALSVSQGGTGINTVTANQILIGGASNTITQLANGSSGLCLVSNGASSAPSFQACTGSGGVSDLDGLTGSISLANSSGSGATITIDDAAADGTTKGIAAFDSTNFTATGGVVNTIQGIATTSTPTFASLTLSSSLTVGNGGTGSTSAAGARTNLGAAASGANSDITSITGLTTALSVSQGGTGLATITANEILIGGASNTITQLAMGSSGECLVSNGGSLAPSFQTCTGVGGGVTSFDTLAGALTLANSTGASGTITIDDAKADGTTKGIAAFNSTNFSDSAGVINTIQDIASTSTPTFGGLTLSTALTVGNGGTGATSAAGALTNLGAAASGANSDITSLSGLTTALSVGQGGTGATSAAGALTNLGAAASGANSDITSLTGLTTALSVSQGGTGLNTVTANQILLGGASNTITQLSNGTSGDCLVSNGAGSAPSFQTCTGAGGVSDIDGQTGSITLANSSGATGTITIDDAAADGTTKGIAAFDSTNFTATLGVINTIQGIATTSTPNFAGLTLTGGASVTTISASGQITSTVTTGTAPLVVGSTTLVTNLNSDLLDGLDSTAFATATGGAGYIQNQSSGQQSSSNFWISGTGRADTSILTNLLDATTAGGSVAIGTTNATGGINLNQNTAVTGNLTQSSGSIGLTATGTAAVTASGTLTLQGLSASLTTAANGAGNTGSLTIFTGNATGGHAGDISVDTGTSTTGTASIFIGTNNASSVNVGNTAAAETTSIVGGSGTSAISLQAASGGTIVVGTTNSDNVTIGSTAGGATVLQSGGGTSLNYAGTGSAFSVTATASPTSGNALLFASNTAVSPSGNLLELKAGADKFTVDASGNVVAAGTVTATAVQASLFDTASAVALNIGTTNATSINLNQNVTVAAGKTLTLTGANTAGRPATPSEGMEYYDTDIKQLVVYSGGKWQADRQSATLVAASNSTQAEKDSADFVASGSGDQSTLTSALADANPAGALRKTGRVYLFPGTYTVSAVTSIPDNTTLEGAGNSSLVKFNTANGTTRNMFTNTNTAGSATGITIRNLMMDGNGGSVTATQHGIYFNKVGNATAGSVVEGGTLTNLTITNFHDRGIYLDTANYNTINQVASYNNSAGIYVNGQRNTITQNSTHDNVNGILLNGSLYNVITNNKIDSNSSQGLNMNGNSSDNSVSNNSFRANGGSTTNEAISISSSHDNNITNNAVSETNCSVTCYAVDLSDATANSNYVANNSLDGGWINVVGDNNTLMNNAMDGGTILITATADSTVMSSNDLNGGAVTNNGTNSIFNGQSDGTNYLIAPSKAISMTASSSSGYATTIYNSDTGVNADGLLIKLGVADASRTTNNYFIGFADSTGTVAGKIQGGASAVVYTTTGADYAEYFRADPANLPQAGELVTIDPSRPNGVRRAIAGDKITGVISTSPGFVGNGPLCNVDDDNCDSNYAKWNVLVSLNGQVPLKTNNEGGAIHVGDPIGASSVPGVATRATNSNIIGYALTTPDAHGMIQVVVNVSNTSLPQDIQANSLTSLALTINGTANITNLNVSSGATIANLHVLTGATFDGNVTVAGAISVGDITVNGHVITSGVAPTGILNSEFSATGVSVTVDGNDTTGTITITTDGTHALFNDPNWPTSVDMTNGVSLLNVKFNKQFSAKARVLLSPANASAAKLGAFTSGESTDSFQISANTMVAAGKSYTFTYWVAQ